ncbi:MAG: hypothetical protein HQK58_13360 [Deltaproteobacteria bacterium]|nr:hypothetical protein [Deltaproteobacteria bacterium]
MASDRETALQVFSVIYLKCHDARVSISGSSTTCDDIITSLVKKEIEDGITKGFTKKDLIAFYNFQTLSCQAGNAGSKKITYEEFKEVMARDW